MYLGGFCKENKKEIRYNLFFLKWGEDVVNVLS